MARLRVRFTFHSTQCVCTQSGNLARSSFVDIFHLKIRFCFGFSILSRYLSPLLPPQPKSKHSRERAHVGFCCFWIRFVCYVCQSGAARIATLKWMTAMTHRGFYPRIHGHKYQHSGIWRNWETVVGRPQSQSTDIQRLSGTEIRGQFTCVYSPSIFDSNANWRPMQVP